MFFNSVFNIFNVTSVKRFWTFRILALYKYFIIIIIIIIIIITIYCTWLCIFYSFYPCTCSSLVALAFKWRDWCCFNMVYITLWKNISSFKCKFLHTISPYFIKLIQCTLWKDTNSFFYSILLLWQQNWLRPLWTQFYNILNIIINFIVYFF